MATARKGPHRLPESGQILILFAVVLPVLAVMVALMVDIGGAAITYHRAQVALDAAAFAAAQAVDLDALDHTQSVQLDPYLAGQLGQQLRSLAEKVAVQIHAHLAKVLQQCHSWISHRVLLVWFADHSGKHTMAFLASRIYTTL